MSLSHRPRRHLTFAVLATLALAAFIPAATTAQTQVTDARWGPWLGCWTSDETAVVCVIPTSRAAAVELVTIKNGQVAFREVIDASGAPTNRTNEGCNGIEYGRWSDDGRRLYLRSEFQCGANAKRTGTELLAISPAGEWIDSVSVSMGENTGVRTTRRHATWPQVIPVELASSISPRPGTTSRNQGVVTPVGFAEIIEATRQLDAPVVEAWLAIEKPRIHVDAKRLADLSRNGVPDDIIDTLVALSYPEKFQVEAHMATSYVPAVRRTAGQVVIVDPAPIYVVEPSYLRYPSYDCRFDTYRWDRCNGWRPAQDVIIVTGPTRPAPPPPPHGRVTKDGYQSGETSNRTANPDQSQSSDSSNGDLQKKPAASQSDPAPPRTARPR